jgi:hypothetical protein
MGVKLRPILKKKHRLKVSKNRELREYLDQQTRSKKKVEKTAHFRAL